MLRHGAAKSSLNAHNHPPMRVVELQILARMELAVVDVLAPGFDLRVGEEVNGEHSLVSVRSSS